MRQRLDVEMVARRLVGSRSQAESYIRLGEVKINGKPVSKTSRLVSPNDVIELTAAEQYVSRAGLKLASVAQDLNLKFTDTTVLDVGSSTGGFTDYALRHGAAYVVAVDVGTKQLHQSLRGNQHIELHEQTDIRDYVITWLAQPAAERPSFDSIVMDVSFISLTDILPSIARLCTPATHIVAMVKPQFEAGREQVHKGVIKNDTVRRAVLKEFEVWTQRLFTIETKADSKIAGAKGNHERFYSLRVLKK